MSGWVLEYWNWGTEGVDVIVVVSGWSGRGGEEEGRVV